MPELSNLIQALHACPCCGAEPLSTANAEDGIPDGYAFEAMFGCGAQVFVEDEGGYVPATGCPDALRSALNTLWDKVDMGLEGDLP